MIARTFRRAVALARSEHLHDVVTAGLMLILFYAIGAVLWGFGSH